MTVTRCDRCGKEMISMALLSLDRHDVLETIRQSDSLHEAFLRVAKLPAVGEYRTATNADRIRGMTDEEIENWFWWMHKEKMQYTDSRVFLHDWLKQEISE